MRVGDIAELLRCQVPRERADGAPLAIISAEDIEETGPARFVPRKPVAQVEARLSSRSEKFLLRQHDILIVIAGGMKAMGNAAFAAFRPEQDAITTKNLLIVRPKPEDVDAVWLYYRLAQPDIRERCLAMVTEGRTHYLSPDAVGNIELNTPARAEVEAAHAAHEVFLEGYRANAERAGREMKEWEKLGRIIRGGS